MALVRQVALVYRRHFEDPAVPLERQLTLWTALVTWPACLSFLLLTFLAKYPFFYGYVLMETLVQFLMRMTCTKLSQVLWPSTTHIPWLISDFDLEGASLYWALTIHFISFLWKKRRGLVQYQEDFAHRRTNTCIIGRILLSGYAHMHLNVWYQLTCGVGVVSVGRLFKSNISCIMI